MKRVESCCLCFSVQVGAYILGILEVSAFVGSLSKFEPIMMAIHGAIAMLFLAMWIDDSGQKRKYYFIAYTSVACLSLIALMLFLIGVLGKGQDVEMLAERVCKEMSEKDLKAMHYKNQD